MSQSFPTASRRPRAFQLQVARKALFVGLLSLAAFTCPLSAQTPAPDSTQNASAIQSPASAPADSTPVSIPAAASSATLPGIDSSSSAFGGGQHSTASSAQSGNSWQWNQSTLDPAQTAPNFGNYSGAYGGAMGANSARGFGSGRQGAGGFNPTGGTRQLGGANNLFGPSTYGLPSLNQLIRGSYNLPLNSSTGSLRFVYQDTLKPDSSLGDLAHPSAGVMFSTPDLGNGMSLSAGTSYGHSSVGAPAVGANAAGKHSGPSLGVKLSF